MGGRGASFKNTKISPVLAKVTYNAAKKSIGSGVVTENKKLDAEIKKNTLNLAKGKNIDVSISNPQKMLENLQERLEAVNKKIAALPSAQHLQRRKDLYYERVAIQKMQDRVREEYNKTREVYGPRSVENNTITTTYDRYRKRREKNFDAWFYGK